MADAPKSNRRDFLRGKAAAEAIADVADGLVALDAPPKSTYLVQYGRRAMACQFELHLNAGQYPQAGEAALAGLDLIEQLEAQLTVYRDTSEVMHLNRTAGQQPVDVEPRLFELLVLAARLHEETEGAFDITSGPLSKVWGFYRRQGSVPDEAALAEALARVGGQHVRLDEERRTVQLMLPGMELNLGSIGKGYALDRAAGLLRESGVVEFLWHGGQSSVLASGSHAASSAGERGWVVGLRDPLRPERRLAEIRLLDQALGTSGAGMQFFRHQGQRLGHILDPRTGWPASGVLSATAIAPTAAEADALATAFYILGVERTLAYCQLRPHLGAILVYQPRPGLPVEVAHTGMEGRLLLSGKSHTASG